MAAVVTHAELKRNDGRNGTVYVGVLGIVYDCSSSDHGGKRPGESYFGEGGPYHVMAGRDASYALSKMSLKATDMDKFVFDPDEEELQVLARAPPPPTRAQAPQHVRRHTDTHTQPLPHTDSRRVGGLL